MRPAFLLLLLLIASTVSGSCSGNADADKPANVSGGSSNQSTASNPGQSVNPKAPPPVQAGNQSSENTIGISTKRKITDVPGAGRPVLQFEPGPEDSQLAQAMNSSGQMYEVRIWKRHPQLLKVESVWVDAKNKYLTIALRTGKVLNITTDRIPNLKLATANQLLEMAGIQPAAATPAIKGAPKKAQ